MSDEDTLIGRPVQCPKCNGWMTPGAESRHDCAAVSRTIDPAFFPPVAIPAGPSAHYVFSTWRDAIAAAHRGIAAATEHRERVFLAATQAGLSRREIGEACGLSAAAVQKIVGKPRASLDDPVYPEAPVVERHPTRNEET